MYFKNFFFGILLGIGFIIPGVSGGVIATILGIYDQIICKLNNLFNNFKNSISYLFPIVFGVFVGVLLFSKIILYLLDNKLHFISYVFIGLIFGCVPYLAKEIKTKTHKGISIIPFILSTLFGVALYLIENNTIESISSPNYLTMFIAGGLYAAGKLIPGISGSALLMLIGIYKYFLSVIANPFSITISIIIKFIPFIISFIISSIIILKLVNYFLTHHFRLTYSAIIGFVISSTLFIYPGYFSLISLVIILISFIISYTLSQ